MSLILPIRAAVVLNGLRRGPPDFCTVGYARAHAALAQAIARGECPGAWAANDGAALWFRDEQLHQVVASRPHAKAYRVERRGTTTLSTRVL